MILKILKKDFLRKKIIIVALFIFIMLPALLMSSGFNMLIEMRNSLDYLGEASHAPHFIQYHSGEIDQGAIDDWSNKNELIKYQQTSEMINIEGSKVFMKDNGESEVGMIMEMGFIKQSETFDFLLNLNNDMIEVKDGEIAVPIYYMQKNDLKIGDQVLITDNKQNKYFTITDFVRDFQMNPSIVSSKRFVVSDNDFSTLKEGFGEVEYIIGFQLHNRDDVTSFSNEYISSGLPQKGPAIVYDLIILFNMLVDGIVAAVIILISLLLSLIALLCLRFTILSTIEEDYREIGVMKAIGISQKDIKKIYLSKYVFLAAIAASAGFIISIFMNKIFTKNILLYMGSAPKSVLEKIIPFMAPCIIFIIVVVFCSIVLRKFKKISAVEAIRMGNTGETFRSTKALALYKQPRINANIFIGIRDVLLRFKLYVMLFIVFIICTFIIIVPLNFSSTIESPEFIRYMGIGKSDILIYLRQSDEIKDRFDETVNYISKDKDVAKYSPLITSRYEIMNSDGYEESISIETGDFTIFPIEYNKGVAPILDNEIALSFLSAKELDKQVGDEVEVLVGENYRTMIVSGVYQDITNGGRTAKANIEPNHKTALWYVVSVEVNSETNEKINEYESIFPEAKITDLEGYFMQTFGNTVKQIKLLNLISMVIACLVAISITSLFLKMLIAKDLSQIAIMRSMGLTLRDIQIQYMTRALIILNSGIIVGTIISHTIGQKLLSAILSVIGASDIKFVVNPIEAYILSPAALIIIVSITTIVSLRAIKELSISDINIE